MILVDTDVLIEILDEDSKKGEAALRKITKGDAALSAKLDLEAEKKGNKIQGFDTMIAAVAIDRSFKLFTFNKKYFEVLTDARNPQRIQSVMDSALEGG
ncbi:MAG: type II toxin-antitoxin system VapC family toxin [Candidatus Methanoperedens sp.]|nr:type II toxin-antitoxin system VapC family toxin [Candidatus Methanoperedens sp.]